MPINTASPQDTFDHMLGSGALSYEWWRGCTSEVDDYDNVPSDWTATITVEDGETGNDKVVTIGHKDVLKAARKVIDSPPKWCSQALIRECRNLIFDNDDTDFDANSADELLQVLCLGEIVYC